MGSFSYRASTRDGQVVEGVMNADGQAAVVTNLRNQGYIPLSISEGEARPAAGKSGSRFSTSIKLPSFSRARRVNNRDLMLFTRELATLIRAGMPLDRSLQSLSQLSENETLKTTLSTVLSQVQEGASLSEAMQLHEKVFPPLYVNMVKAGEAGGVLELVLERLAEYLERAQIAREEIRSAMTYPILLAGASIVVVTILLTVVLPKFTTIFADVGAALPASTRTVMWISDMVRGYWWALVVALVVAWLLFRRLTSSPSGRLKWHSFLLNLPLLGTFIRKSQVANFTRTLGTMLSSGVPLLQSLEIVKAIVTNNVISNAVSVVQQDVSEGKGLSGPLERTGAFPPLALQMVAVGEETGRLDDMLGTVAEHYDRDVTSTLKRLMSVIEPMMLLIMTVVVGFIVVSMVSAVFSVNEVAF